MLPRYQDHAKDLALLSRAKGYQEMAQTLVLDFENAFMSLPLRDDERCYNCTVVNDDLQRGREPLTAAEPQVGRCIVWRGLGFGGRPNPLLYSRAASFAARTAQALLGSPERRKQTVGLTRCRLQLYVDDQVVPAVGYP